LAKPKSGALLFFGMKITQHVDEVKSLHGRKSEKIPSWVFFSFPYKYRAPLGGWSSAINMIGHRSTGASLTWRGWKKRLRRVICLIILQKKYITDYFKRNDFKVDAKQL